MEKNFKFELGEEVTLTKSGETGEVIGRSEFSYANNSYLVRYCAGDGRQVEDWWTETALVSI